MKVLVTGGAGFIGSAVVQRLLSEGHTVRVLDNLETGVKENLADSVELFPDDIRDSNAVKYAVAGCDVIIHLAAMVSVPRSIDDPSLCWEVNVQGTRTVLDAAYRAGCRRMVLASSAAVYGNELALPKCETQPPQPESPYAYSKWMNELDAEYYHRFLGLETVALRFFNVFGPRQRPDSPYSGVISIAASKLLASEPFTVFGTGEQTRDFVYVDDVATAVVAAASYPALGHAVFNVGRGCGTTLLELIELIGKAVGQKPELHFEAPRPGDVLHSVAEVSRLETFLGKREITSLARGVDSLLQWLRTGG